MVLNGAAGPDDELWGLNAPFCFEVDGRPVSCRVASDWVNALVMIFLLLMG
jgi:hypothetical protein